MPSASVGTDVTSRMMANGTRSAPATLLFAEGLEIVHGDGASFEHSLDDDVAIHDPLETANDQSWLANPKLLAHHDQAIARNNRGWELDFVEPPESHQGIIEQFVLVTAIATDLCHGFEHDHAGHEWHSGHMASDPELLIRNVFVADANHVDRVFVDDRGQLFHFVPLRVVFADLFDIRNNFRKVDRSGIDNEIFRRHRLTP
jgi:hypothetical protein